MRELTSLAEADRKIAFGRPHLEDGRALTAVALEAGVAYSTKSEFYDLFLCYNRADQSFVFKLAAAVKSETIDGLKTSRISRYLWMNGILNRVKTGRVN
jgi:hypothetical protein